MIDTPSIRATELCSHLGGTGPEGPRRPKKIFRILLRLIAIRWPEYSIEAVLLGLFMISACVFTVLFELPSSLVRQAVPSAFLRRALTGIAMGLTAIALIYSPWGQRSGAHINPSVTLTFYRLGKIRPCDAAPYIFSQFAGGIAGVMIARIFWEAWSHILMCTMPRHIRDGTALARRLSVSSSFHFCSCSWCSTFRTMLN